MAPGVVALPQSQLTSPVKTELGGGAPQGPRGCTAVRGHQQGRVNIACEEVLGLRCSFYGEYGLTKIPGEWLAGQTVTERDRLERKELLFI